MQEKPSSIAIAGSEGFMGQNMMNAALGLKIEEIILCDPRIDPGRYAGLKHVRIVQPGHFEEAEADLFHIATHPGHRHSMYRLIERGCHINAEKPMVHPEKPEEAQAIFEALKGSKATLLYDFLEMFNPRTHRVIEVVKEMGNVSIDNIFFTRGKNRENLWNPRNRSVMLPIQYQETIHCMAYLVNILASIQGVDKISFGSVFPQGIRVRAKSRRYDAPNPQKYDYIVDGYCRGTIMIGGCYADFLTDFKRGAEKTKEKKIICHNKDISLSIETDNQPCNEYLRINNVEQHIEGEQDQYKNIILGSWQMHQEMRQGIKAVRPDANFAWLTFGLSGAIFMAGYLQAEFNLRGEDDFNKAANYFRDNADSYKRGTYKPKKWFAMAKRYVSDFLDTEGRKDTMPRVKV